MVSGLVTSPCDQLRIFSGEARLMRMASKSAIGFPSQMDSNGTKLSSYPAGLAVANCRSRGPCAAAGGSRFAIDSPGAASCGSSGGSYPDPQIDQSAATGAGDNGLPLVRLDQLHIQAQRLQLANQHVERLRHTRLDGRFALDDGLVNLGAAINVIGLRRQQLLQDVRRAVSFQRPHFHFSEALSTELRLAAQRLLGDERVRTDGTRVDLVVDQVRELEHVDVADRDRLFELARRSCRRTGTSCRKSADPTLASSDLISFSLDPSNTGDAK